MGNQSRCNSKGTLVTGSSIDVLDVVNKSSNYFYVNKWLCVFIFWYNI